MKISIGRFVDENTSILYAAPEESVPISSYMLLAGLTLVCAALLVARDYYTSLSTRKQEVVPVVRGLTDLADEVSMERI